MRIRNTHRILPALALVVLFAAATAHGASFTYIHTQGFNNMSGATWTGGGQTADGLLQFSWGSGGPGTWSQHWRPTVDCPAICATANLGLSLTQPFDALMEAVYGGVTYSLTPNPAGNLITSFVLSISGPISPAALSQEINVPGDYTTYRGNYWGGAPFTASITLHNGATGIDVTIPMSGFTTISANSFYVAVTSTGRTLFWEEGFVADSPIPISPEPSTLAMWALGLGVPAGVAMVRGRWSTHPKS